MRDRAVTSTSSDDSRFLEIIESLMDVYESTEVEFKSGKGGFPGSLWETYSAFANTQGGVIVLGVKEKDGAFKFDGLSEEQVNQYKKIFWDNVNNKSCCSANILKDEDVVDVEHQGSYILFFNIPRAPREKMPVYLNHNYDNTFKRNHEGDYHCTEDEVRRMVADADIDHPRDYKILPEFTIERDIDKLSLDQYRRLVAVKKPDHPWLLLDDKSFLKKLNGYREDRRDKKEGLTLAGLLMFGKTESIIDAYGCPHYFPDYREYFSPDPDDRWTDRICPDETWEANLFQFYYRVYPKLTMVLPKPFALKDGTREEETATHIALREAFINTLIHCDYSVNSNITIELRKDAYTFANPGSLLVPITKYYQGGDSVCRNKALQQMFMMLGAAEKAGSGVDKIMQGWKKANYRNPWIEETTQPNKVVLTLPLVSLLSEDVLSYLVSKFGAGIKVIDHDKLMVLATCCSEKEVNNYRLQFVLKKHSADITKLLRELCDDGYLQSHGVGRGMRYRLKDTPRNMASNGANMASNGANIASKGANIASKGANMASNGANIASKGANVVSNGANVVSKDANVASKDANVVSNGANVASKDANVASKGANVASADANMASHIRTRWPKDVLYAKIMEACAAYVYVEDIALKIGKDVRYLKNHVIPIMIEHKMLERKYPNVPRHPQQQYRAVKLQRTDTKTDRN